MTDARQDMPANTEWGGKVLPGRPGRPIQQAAVGLGQKMARALATGKGKVHSQQRGPQARKHLPEEPLVGSA